MPKAAHQPAVMQSYRLHALGIPGQPCGVDMIQPLFSKQAGLRCRRHLTVVGFCRFENAVVRDPVLEAPAETVIEHNGASQKPDGVSNFLADKLTDKDTEEIKVCATRYYVPT